MKLGTRLAFLDRDAAFEALPKVITLMGGKLGWDAARQEKEYDSAVSFLDTMHAWAYYKVCVHFLSENPQPDIFVPLSPSTFQ